MPTLAEDINRRSSFLFQAVNDGYVPKEYTGLTEGMTGYNSHGQDVFTLNPPIAGCYKDLSLDPGIDIDDQPEGDRFILRGVLGYSLVLRMSQDPALLILTLAGTINSIVGAAYRVYGPRIQRLTFDRPGGVPEYLIELENTAGYEIHLWGELTPVIRFEMEDVSNGI